MLDRQNQTVLLVEDSVTQRAHAVKLLQQNGYGHIVEAVNGIDALHWLEAQEGGKPDLIMTDLEMPGMDGIEFIRHLCERGMDYPIVVTSGRDPRLLEIVERMLTTEAGLRLLGTLPKPVRADDLAEVLAHVPHTGAARGVRGRTGSHGLDKELPEAIRQGQIVAYFQPKVCMRTGLVKGVEALARWEHPTLGLVGPDEFLPLLEGSPLMMEFTLAIVRHVITQCEYWREHGMASMQVSINLSAANLSDRPFLDSLTALVSEAELSTRRITWEVTESAMMENKSESLANLARLRLKGFGLSMDDYGVGYSSIHLFSLCPFSELKIDRSFVQGAAHKANRRAILGSTIEMGHRLQVQTVAEGVETQEDWDTARKLGSDFAQGYLMARALPGHDLPKWTVENSARLKSLVRGKEASPVPARRPGNDLPGNRIDL